MNVVIITGASSGIGREFAYQLDQGLDTIDEFWLIARRKDRLKDLAATLRHNTRCLELDLTKDGSFDFLECLLKEKKAIVRILVNSAGMGVMGDFQGLTEKEIADQINLNCMALSIMTRRVLTFMRSGSRIFQMASSAGFVPQADFSVYAASKAYVLSLSKALNMELKDRNISCLAICPGPVDTEFFDIAEKNGNTLSIKKIAMVSPERVVKKALLDSRLGLNVSVCSPLMMGVAVICKLLPHDIILSSMNIMKRMSE